MNKLLLRRADFITDDNAKLKMTVTGFRSRHDLVSESFFFIIMQII